VITVLFSSAGRRTELLNCFRKDAVALGESLRVLAVDVQPEFSSAFHGADASFKAPHCLDEGFVPRLLDICRNENVKLLVPTIDTELEVLADAQEEFAAIGTRVHISSSEVVRTARDKAATAEFLTGAGIPTPRTGTVPAVLRAPEARRWPLILKPIAGSSSTGICIARDLAEFHFAARLRDDFLVQEYWIGREFTINIFFDQSGTLRSAIPHWRKETRAGEVSKGITCRHPLIMELSDRLGSVLKGARGALCFQAIVNDSGEAAIFEINARFGGGYPLAHRAGGAFSRWLLEEAAGRECTATNEWQDGLMMLRYDAAVFASAPPGP
jgi:carbamoyl-phosphate synthase large subunit